MTNHSPDTHHFLKRSYIGLLKKNKKILSSFLAGLIGFGLIMGTAGAVQDNAGGQDHQRKVSFSVDDWPRDVERFVKVERDGSPITSGSGSNATVYRVARSGELLQFLTEQMVITFGNPLGGPAGGSGVMYKIKMLDGREGWVAGPPYSSRFETQRIYREDAGGGSTPAQRKILRIQKPIILDFGSRQLLFKKGDFLFITGEGPSWMTVESINGLTGSWKEETLKQYGYFEVISWYAEWDAMIKRKSPPIIMMVSAILIGALAFLTILNDPRRGEKAIKKAIFLIYFSLTSFGYVGSAVASLRGYASLATHLSMRRYDVVLEVIVLSLILPYALVVIFFFEGAVVALIRCKYLFSKKSAKEALMERTNRKEQEAIKNEYETKKEEIKNREGTIKKKLSSLRGDLPEVIDAIPEDLTDYQGYFSEVEKRFQERQIMKTTKVARKRLEEVRKLCEEGARLQRARADLEMANHEFSTVDKDISLKDKERILKDKVLDRDILETDADIARLKRMSEKKEEREDFGI